MSKLYMEANFNLTFWTSNIILKNVPRLSLTEWGNNERPEVSKQSNALGIFRLVLMQNFPKT